MVSYPDLSPSPELSYIIGVHFGDGCLRGGKVRNKHWIILKVKDWDFAKEYARCLSRILKKEITVKKGYTDKRYPGNLYWRVQVASKLLYNFLLQGSFNEIINKYPGEFVRGFFDSEGSCLKNNNRIRLRAACRRKEVLVLIQKALNLLGINSYIRGPYRSAGDIYYLTIPSGYFQTGIRKENIIKFRNKVGFSIGRKMRVLEAANSSIP